ncbi:Mrp/NBP35 family ATP-binding protein [Qingshengfaniella alkalisoli]|uniref:Iron-sulfur cluster carrier protein n=1 Tax=Qingshengfaniella alkalisoli TaxID=2599296 RepID=A0A5B8IYQ3_9RHOB|nr:Mrp/NBP35 family ATP-binding protein [Qingshengfaniella alkalisoli]QDY69788.1 Mrp/NBP35 family ATP-binding protein [Qingshengfaniella alkalisoli]
MSSVTKEAVLERLARVRGPDRTEDLVSLGLISGLNVQDGKVTFAISVPPERAPELEPMRQAAENLVREIEGVEQVIAVLTAERATPPPPEPPRLKPAGSHQAPPKGGLPKKEPIPGVGAIIAVASGKGGVGKSTTSVNLALALQAQGLKVGILDADIYGPSMPRLLGVSDKPEAVDGRMVPPTAFGLKVMSMGFLVDEDAPMVWRGPMVMSAITQMLRQVDWSPLDVMIVDMPPGTGDAQLTMSQNVPLAGAVIVSTPQDIALIDARKGLNMFRKVDVPILGIVENMSYFLCPSCGEKSDIFGHGGAREEADRMGVPFLGEVPLHMEIRRNSDGGTPVVVSAPDGEHAKLYASIASTVRDRLKAEAVS